MRGTRLSWAPELRVGVEVEGRQGCVQHQTARVGGTAASGLWDRSKQSIGTGWVGVERVGVGNRGGQEVGREGEGVREVQECCHSNGSLLCSEAELPLGKEIKCFLLISVGKVIDDKLLQPREGWRAQLVGMCMAAAHAYVLCTQGARGGWA